MILLLFAISAWHPHEISRIRMRMSKFVRISADPDAELRYTSTNKTESKKLVQVVLILKDLRHCIHRYTESQKLVSQKLTKKNILVIKLAFKFYPIDTVKSLFAHNNWIYAKNFQFKIFKLLTNISTRSRSCVAVDNKMLMKSLPS